MGDIVRGQIDYYRARAAEYDEWFFRQGRYDRGPEENARWFDEVAEVEAALMAAKPRGNALELACGTGLWTGHLAARARRVTAVDAVCETLDLNRARVSAEHVDYVEADIFTWRPPETGRYDFIFFGFWISHIPRAQWNGFWSMLADALAPGGTVFFVDNRHYESRVTTSNRRNQGGDQLEDRTLNDGRRFPIVKNFFVPAELEADLAERGWRSSVCESATYFVYGTAARQQDLPASAHR
jgi:SAM-dependent methyltransferase